jgi:HlyD family secretion protein
MGDHRSGGARARALAVLLAAGFATAACGPPGGRPPPNAQASPGREAALTVTVARLEPVELPRTVTLNGSVFAWQEVIIAPEVGGYRVAEVHVDVGDRVRKGQQLVELSTALLNAEVESRRAELRQREAALVNAQAALTRGRSLAQTNLLSAADLDRLESEALVASAAVEAARADLETAMLRLKFTSVTAPDDGIITARTVTVGQIAQAGAEMLRLLRDGRVEWRGEVPETALGTLAPGQPVTITTADGTKFTGTIRVVAPTITSTNRTGLVYVDLPSDERLRPGMFARGEIETGRGMAFAVPLASIVTSDGYNYVFVVGEDNVVERRRIETGAIRGARIEVVSGVGAGDVVVEAGAGFLKDGDRVNVAAAAVSGA